MEKLITITELEEIREYVLVKEINKTYYVNRDLLNKLINSYKHYKELSVELELKLDEVWNDYQ